MSWVSSSNAVPNEYIPWRQSPGKSIDEIAGVLPTQGPELGVSNVVVGQRDVARTLLPLNTSSEIDLVIQRHFRNCGLSLTTRL